MIALDLSLGFFAGAILTGFCLYVYFQKKISAFTQDVALSQDRLRRFEGIETLLLKREEELRLQGERNAELRVALQRTEKESQSKREKTAQ